MKVLTIIGARPQFIKSGPVSQAMQESGISEVTLHTGQHYDSNMSDVFFDQMKLHKPTHRLALGSLSHGAQTGRMLEQIETILLEEKPDWTLVYGDTNSTLAGALASAKLHIPIAHVESGLRSFNKRMPEEINRILTDHASDLLFTPSQKASTQLRKEAIPDRNIVEVGDVMLDALLQYQTQAPKADTVLSRYPVDSSRFILATIHRAENTDHPERLANIFSAFEEISKEVDIVIPIHPRTRKKLVEFGINCEHVTQIEPLGYLEMLSLQAASVLIATDSGGVQKEAFFLKTPCVTLRDETEWTELVESKWNFLCSPVSKAAVKDAILSQLESRGEECAPYGEGNASTKIAETLLTFRS